MPLSSFFWVYQFYHSFSIKKSLSKRLWIHVHIGVDLGAARARAPNNRETPKHLSLFASPIFWFGHWIFFTSLHHCMFKVYTDYRPTCPEPLKTLRPIYVIISLYLGQRSILFTLSLIIRVIVSQHSMLLPCTIAWQRPAAFTCDDSFICVGLGLTAKDTSNYRLPARN